MTSRVASDRPLPLQRVTALEKQYAEAMLAYYRGEGALPPEAMHSELVRMRQEANRLLMAALTEIDRRLDEINRNFGGH